tara:strand:- start:58 stop:393 length:336 start_codon:yes stop_codon:yes gene_type:complete
VYKLFLILLFSFVFTQEPCIGTCMSEEDMIQLAKNIEKLESDISIYIKIMEQDSITITKQDSLILVLNQKYDLCDARLKEVEPKWYENKWLYLLIGAFSVKSIDEAFQKID